MDNGLPNTTGKRIKALMTEYNKGKEKKDRITNDSLADLWNYSDSHSISPFLNDHKEIDNYKIKKASDFFTEKFGYNISTSYLKCETDYRNTTDMANAGLKQDTIKKQALQELLFTYGYEWHGDYCFSKIGEYLRMDESNKLDLSMYNFIIDNIVIELKTPKGLKYIRNGDLKQLVNDFFALLETRLSDSSDIV